MNSLITRLRALALWDARANECSAKNSAAWEAADEIVALTTSVGDLTEEIARLRAALVEITHEDDSASLIAVNALNN